MRDYQLVIIGAGPGGYESAIRAGTLGLRTALIEKKDVGGTCLNRGCIPTKCLLHSSELYREAKDGASYGILAWEVRYDLKEMFEREKAVIKTLRTGVEKMVHSAGVDLIRGTASILEPHKVSVNGSGGLALTLTADSILIATGAVPARPPIPGLELPGILTSDEILEGADQLYDSLVILGGGVIGVEIATFYSDLGCAVTIIEGLDRLLPNMDRELGQSLASVLKKEGVKIHTCSMVRKIERTGDNFEVFFEAKGRVDSVTGDHILCAFGRSPFTDGLFPEKIQPKKDGRFLRVDDQFCTSIEEVYAIGDVSSRMQLAHVARAQGIAVAEHLAGFSSDTDMGLVPSCVYCRPEIASVGMTEAQAKEIGIPVRVGKCVMGGNGRTVISGTGRSFMKIVGNSEDHRILGAQLMCRNSTDMISEISAAIANRQTVEDLLKIMRPHPTFEEAMTNALWDLKKKIS